MKNNQQYRVQDPIEEAYRNSVHECICCHRELKERANDYVMFAGDVYIGRNGGIIGHNFQPDGRLGRVMFLCISNCLRIFLDSRVY